MAAVSVIIRARDEAADIGEVLDRLARQSLAAEVIVVDSGSRDGTARIARGRGARVLEIAPESFSFGGALNTGCAEATAPVCVALSAHALPLDDGWLERIASACSEEGVACASGDRYGPDGRPLHGRVRQDAELARRHPRWGYSNAAGAFRTELWRERPFREDLPGVEDKEWAWSWLRRGWCHVVGSDLVVEHDHTRDPLRDIYVRARREATGLAMFLDDDPPRALELVREWWSEHGTYASAVKARLSHRRAARLLGAHVGRRRRALVGRADGALAPLRVAVMIERFPVLSETFVTTEIEELRALGHHVSVEALRRAPVPNPAAPADVHAAFVADEAAASKLAALAWLVARRPRGCARDLVERRRWRAEEEVPALRALAVRARRLHRRRVELLHVHFATRQAQEALRLSRLLDVPWSLTAHAFDIFARPANLTEKLERASFVTTGCDYNVDHLRRVAPRAAIHRIVMGVDGERFRRSVPLPGARTVLAVGRLVEKKGFEHLIAACALLHAREPLDAVVLVGDGPERERLEALARRAGVADLVRFAGAQPPAQVRAALEAADVLAMPAVIARDGDRDSMPVVVKEAMAMELLVAASDEVGLPEIVREPWGRLSPPGDAPALADALSELLALPASERAAAGRAARAFVLEHASSARETARLAQLMRATTRGR